MTYVLQTFAVVLMVGCVALFSIRISQAEYALAIIPAILFTINAVVFFINQKIRNRS